MAEVEENLVALRLRVVRGVVAMVVGGGAEEMKVGAQNEGLALAVAPDIASRLPQSGPLSICTGAPIQDSATVEELGLFGRERELVVEQRQ